MASIQQLQKLYHIQVSRYERPYELISLFLLHIGSDSPLEVSS